MVEDVSDLLGAAVGDFDTDMRFICHEGLTEAFLLAWGEPVARGAQKIADLGRGDPPCARGDPMYLAGRGDVPHLERRQRA